MITFKNGRKVQSLIVQNYIKIIKKSICYVDIKNSCKKNKTDSLGDKDVDDKIWGMRRCDAGDE